MKRLTGRASGTPDYILFPALPLRRLKSSRTLHFTTSLAKGESEQENLSGLEANRIIITRLTILSRQPLLYRLLFFSRDTFTQSDLDLDTFVGSADADLSKYGQRLWGTLSGGGWSGDWHAETAWPIAFSNIRISQIFLNAQREPELYVVSTSAFYRYNLATKAWTQRADPPYDSKVDGASAIYRNGKLYTTGESTIWDGDRRIMIYDPVANSWSFSSRGPDIAGNPSYISGFCFQDDDTIWAWAKRGGSNYFKVMKYTISTDTWTQYTNTITPGATGYPAPSAGYYRGQVFAIHPVTGAAVDVLFLRYTIDSDAYSESSAHENDSNYIYGQAGPFLLYRAATASGASNLRLRYFDIRDESWHDSPFPVNPFATAFWYSGVALSEDGLWAFDSIGTTAPQSYSYVPVQYYIEIKGLHIPYEDKDKTKELHLALRNQSPTAKNAGSTGEITVELGYELAA